MQKKDIGIIVVIVGVLISIFFVNHSLSKKSTSQVSTDREQKEVKYKEASWYEQLANGTVRCNLCPNRCTLGEGQRGICNVRQNIGGKLYSLVYGNPVSIAVDPIEKKPLFHFLPGSKAYSLATAGCNLDCKYCQNWDIAHRMPEELQNTPMTPEEVVQNALNSNAEIIAFTYNEPTVWYEYMLDIAKKAKENNLRTVAISSGYINQEPLKELLPYLDAYKVDLKSFNEETYETLMNGQLEPVLNTIKTISETDTWLELVYLVVPTYTDNLGEIKEMCEWIKDNVGDEVPLHFSRFWPQYKLTNLPPTPEESLKSARKTCQDVGLKYVYVGNIQYIEGGTTYCPSNEEAVIVRDGYFIKENLVNAEGIAEGCDETIPGVWK
ncbi:AmmeMemoRadiSam system radical SAM enzyme [Patescibacteria group bacterium]|nr:AmmeMemoRadiSam system radical SAM enzyme [Patescibacteria group bacterium]